MCVLGDHRPDVRSMSRAEVEVRRRMRTRRLEHAHARARADSSMRTRAPFGISEALGMTRAATLHVSERPPCGGKPRQTVEARVLRLCSEFDFRLSIIDF